VCCHTESPLVSMFEIKDGIVRLRERLGCLVLDRYPFCDTSLSLDERVDDLIGRLKFDEKVSTVLSLWIYSFL
jgi:hypothetical protein